MANHSHSVSLAFIILGLESFISISHFIFILSFSFLILYSYSYSLFTQQPVDLPSASGRHFIHNVLKHDYIYIIYIVYSVVYIYVTRYSAIRIRNHLDLVITLLSVVHDRTQHLLTFHNSNFNFDNRVTSHSIEY